MLTCNVVKDLLPNYVDGLVSETTAQEIAEHLTMCADCRNAYECMKAPLAPIVTGGEKEVDYLKKIRAKSKFRALKFSAISVGVVVALVAVFLLVFVHGTPVGSNDLYYTASVAANGDYVVDMTLKTTSALSVSVEMVYEGEGEAQKLKEIILTPRQVPEFIQEGNRYNYGISGDVVRDFQNGNVRMVIHFADKTVELTLGDFAKD